MLQEKFLDFDFSHRHFLKYFLPYVRRDSNWEWKGKLCDLILFSFLISFLLRIYQEQEICDFFSRHFL